VGCWTRRCRGGPPRTPWSGGARSPGRPVAVGAGRPEHEDVRVCALVAVIACGVLAVPATARSDPFSTATQQQADAAISDAQALASQELAASSSVVATAAASEPESVPTSAAGVEREAAKAVSDVIASATAAPTSATATPPPREQRPASPPAAHRNHHRPPPRGRRSAAHVTTPGWAGPAAAGPSSLRATSGAPPAPASAAQRSRRSATPDHSAGSGPHRLPPVPMPPQGLNGGAEGGGSGTPTPLLVGALAAALLFVLFEFLSRLLPRSAFRKPRRLVLPPWHPG